MIRLRGAPQIRERRGAQVGGDAEQILGADVATHASATQPSGRIERARKRWLGNVGYQGDTTFAPMLVSAERSSLREPIPSLLEHLPQVPLHRAWTEEDLSADLGIRLPSACRRPGTRPAPPVASARRVSQWCACAPSRRWPAARDGRVRRKPLRPCPRASRKRFVAARERRRGCAGGAATRRRGGARGQASGILRVWIRDSRWIA